jgi:hypothetical protein
MCAFLLFFARGREWLGKRAGVRAWRWGERGVDVGVAGLAALYVLDVGSVMIELWRSPGSG